MKCPKCNNDNPDDALYCGVCYESFKKPKETAPERPPMMVREEPVSESSEPSGGFGFFKILLIVALCVGGYFAYKNYIPSAIAEAPIAEPATVAEKIELAEKFLYEKNETYLAFFNDIEKRKLKLKDFNRGGKHIKKYNKASAKFIDKLNALKLPCPQTQAAHDEPGYVHWSADYRERSSEIMKKHSQKLNQIIKKVARAEHPDIKIN